MYVVGNGQGSPCLDLRRVPGTLADATAGADLVCACPPKHHTSATHCSLQPVDCLACIDAGAAGFCLASSPGHLTAYCMEGACLILVFREASGGH